MLKNIFCFGHCTVINFEVLINGGLIITTNSYCTISLEDWYNGHSPVTVNYVFDNFGNLKAFNLFLLLAIM